MSAWGTSPWGLAPWGGGGAAAAESGEGDDEAPVPPVPTYPSRVIHTAAATIRLKQQFKSNPA